MIFHFLLVFYVTLSQWLDRHHVNNGGLVLLLKFTLVPLVLQFGQLNQVKLPLPRILDLSQVFDPRQAIVKQS